MFIIRPEEVGDGPAIEILLDQSFGKNRRQRASYRFRRGVPPIASLCFIAADETDMVVGAIRYWPVRLDETPALLLGPLAIATERRGRGVGRALVYHSLEAASREPGDLVFLVGDPAYYSRFGFSPAPTSIVMPGEQPERLNMRRLSGADAGQTYGTLRAVPASDAMRPLPPDPVKAIATALPIP